MPAVTLFLGTCMKFQIKCPDCNTIARVSSDPVGQIAKCPKCSESFRVSEDQIVREAPAQTRQPVQEFRPLAGETSPLVGEIKSIFGESPVQKDPRASRSDDPVTECYYCGVDDKPGFIIEQSDEANAFVCRDCLPLEPLKSLRYIRIHLATIQTYVGWMLALFVIGIVLAVCSGILSLGQPSYTY